MEFKVGQKYRIVDIDAWWDKNMFDETTDSLDIVDSFKNGDEILVSESGYESMFVLASNLNYSSMFILELIEADQWHDSCIELITDDTADASKMEEQSDDTISLYHIADVLEDACINTDLESISSTVRLLEVIETCIKSLRKAGY